ncbi:MAG: type III pantothenate kinase [Brevinema sp.]
MLIAIDIGNTNTKFVFFDNQATIVNKYIIQTSALWTPNAWKEKFDQLIAQNPLFSDAKITISCVNWKTFLVLRVVFGCDHEDCFDIDLPFDPKLLELEKHIPIVLEQNIPVNLSHTIGLSGSDRILAAYATYQKYKQSTVVVSLGTATTIDLITEKGVYFAGPIVPGIETSYQGLINQAPHLPSLESLPKDQHHVLCQGILQSLSTGLFFAHSAVIESIYHKQIHEAQLTETVGLLITGGNAPIISPYISVPHIIEEDMVAYGLFLLYMSEHIN